PEDRSYVSNAPLTPMQQNRYGDFLLTGAVRPGPGVPVTPAEGYRLSRFRDAETQICLPVLGASVSAEKLFDVFLELLEPLGPRAGAAPGSGDGPRAAPAAEPTPGPGGTSACRS